MKKAFLQIFLALLCLSAQAQKVSNIRAEQRGQEIVILYSLETATPCEVGLMLSQDNGVTWGSPLKNVSGDVGKSISARQKSITWKVLEEQEQLVGSKIKFKVISTGKKALAPVDHEMVFVEGGMFQMGSNAGKAVVRPVHPESVSSFNIGKYEVTQAEWNAVMGNNPSNFKGCDNCPVENVTWNDVQTFIEKLNTQSKKNYRLPSEAEWEYAAKGGISSKNYSYSGSEDINAVGWYGANGAGKTNYVGSKQANELGIYDMSGNVYEWCSDLYGNSEAAAGISMVAQTTPAIPMRVLRGGSWVDGAKVCRTAYRSSFDPSKGNFFSGFRLVLPVD